jgi:type IV secretory pathway TraG/TraD family ATPase VirD4
VLFVLDEFYTLQSQGRLEAVDVVLASGRKFGVYLWICLQNFPELRALYRELSEHFINSVGCLQIMSVTDPEGSAWVSNMCGESEALTWSRSNSRSGGQQPSANVSDSYGQVPRKLALPGEVREMAPDKMLMFFDTLPGVPVVGVRKPYWLMRIKHLIGKNKFAPR